jgi:hypothetical protein
MIHRSLSNKVGHTFKRNPIVWNYSQKHVKLNVTTKNSFKHPTLFKNMFVLKKISN